MKPSLVLFLLLLTMGPIESPRSAWGENGVLERMEDEIASIVGKARPLVVSIRADHPEPGRSGRWQRNVGSGVVLDSEGHILTAESVIRGAERIEVVAISEKKYPAEPVGFDPESGLAVIRVKEPAFSASPFGDSDRVQIGRWTLVVGNSMGVVSASAFGLITGFREGGRWIQINTRIYPGNGGAPLFDSKGRLIGIVIGELSPHRSDPSRPGVPSATLAIPINEARRVARHLIADGEITYGWLGVTAGPVNTSTEKPQVMVWQVARHSPAHKAGIRRGDLILTYKGHPIKSVWELAHRVRTTSVGQVVNIGLRRADRRVSMPVRIEKKPPSRRVR
ncbi:MAG: trypsin-like peptidase domain-containing protein [Candidatus Latescibacteria bacterium]|nr:trypsin-like peptidase domain-containing protein [Candidatus Latescibacterota bacterium]